VLFGESILGLKHSGASSSSSSSSSSLSPLSPVASSDDVPIIAIAPAALVPVDLLPNGGLPVVL
jgi:hypothetical protein